MKRKVLSIILCTVWILICFLVVFVPKEYMSSLPDEISVENRTASGSIIEYDNERRIKVYREGGKYFLSSQNLVYKTEPKIVELTKSEYRYCTRVDTYRLENQVTGGASSYEYSICVKKGDKEEKYNDNFIKSPLYEMEMIEDIKFNRFDLNNATSKKLVRLERFLDEGNFEMACFSYPSTRIEGHDSYYYKNANCKEEESKWWNLFAEYKQEQDLNVFLFKQYEKGKIELKDINLKASLDKKVELFESITGSTAINYLGGGYNYKDLLTSNDKPITSKSKQTILDDTTDKLDGYDHTAYEYTEYGKNNYCLYELYLPDEENTYVLIVEKPLLMPKWYLKWAINTIILNDKLIVSPGLIYQVVLFMFLTIPIFFLIGLFGSRRKE